MDQSDTQEPVLATPGDRFARSVLSWYIILMNHSVIQLFFGIIKKCISRYAKNTEIGKSSENCFFGNKTLLITKEHWKTFEVYFIKWTTSGEPSVGFRSPWKSYFRNKKHFRTAILGIDGIYQLSSEHLSGLPDYDDNTNLVMVIEIMIYDG